MEYFDIVMYISYLPLFDWISVVTQSMAPQWGHVMHKYGSKFSHYCFRSWFVASSTHKPIKEPPMDHLEPHDTLLNISKNGPWFSTIQKPAASTFAVIYKAYHLCKQKMNDRLSHNDNLSNSTQQCTSISQSNMAHASNKCTPLGLSSLWNRKTLHWPILL